MHIFIGEQKLGDQVINDKEECSKKPATCKNGMIQLKRRNHTITLIYKSNNYKNPMYLLMDLSNDTKSVLTEQNTQKNEDNNIIVDTLHCTRFIIVIS